MDEAARACGRVARCGRARARARPRGARRARRRSSCPTSMPKPCGERQHAPSARRRQRALAGDRRARRSPQRRRIAQRAKPQREPEAAADAPGEGRHREVAPRRARPRRRARAGCAARSPRSPSQSTNDRRRVAAPARSAARACGRASTSAPPLPIDAPAAHDLARRPRARPRRSRRVEPSSATHHARAGEARARARRASRRSARPRCGRRRLRSRARGASRSSGARSYCPAVTTAIVDSGGHMADVEAHITGTVWKIECAVGDQSRRATRSRSSSR